MFLEVNRLRMYLASLTVYRHLLADPVIEELASLLNVLYNQREGAYGLIKAYHRFLGTLMKAPIQSLQDYILEKVLFDETPCSQAMEKWGEPQPFMDAFTRDLYILGCLAQISPDWMKQVLQSNCQPNPLEKKTIEELLCWPERDLRFRSNVKALGFDFLLSSFDDLTPWETHAKELTQFYADHGAGLFVRYKAFQWERQGDNGRLKGIDAPDTIRLGNLYGYSVQQQTVVQNTEQFLQGQTANNVLLYGDRGTGKSSTVKALLHAYHDKGLRLIEVPKRFMLDLPAVIDILRYRTGKFILFIDDLAFDDDEEHYTSLKAVLEGTIASRPANILIYATSNRRHIIRESFSDRAGLRTGNEAEELHAADTLQEKLSFADRFGITVAYLAPTQKQYLVLVDALANQRGIRVPQEILHQKALKWELKFNGRSPRTAKQFIDSLAGTVLIET